MKSTLSAIDVDSTRRYFQTVFLQRWQTFANQWFVLSVNLDK
jgi:hypothetical protein